MEQKSVLGQQKRLEPACFFHALQVQLCQVLSMELGGGAVNQRSTLVAMLLRFGKKQFGNSNDFCCFKAVLQIKKQR